MVRVKDLELAVRNEFRNLEFYNKKYDSLRVSKSGNKTYSVNYDAANEIINYFSCYLELDFAEMSATWCNINLDDECKGRGWGGDLIKKGESLFRKLGMQTAYVSGNMNPGFWTSMGYPASLKILRKRVKKKNFYYHAHELISYIGFGKSNSVSISGSNNSFELDYIKYKNNWYSKLVSIEVRVELSKKTAALTRVEAPNNKIRHIILKCEDVLKEMGVRKVYGENYSAGPIWEKLGYTYEDYTLCKTLY